MKKFKDSNNAIHEFEDNCFDEKGNCINEIAKKIIEENNLISISDEEAKEIKRLEIEKITLEFLEQQKKSEGGI